MRLLLILLAVAAHGIGYAATLTGTVVESAAAVDLAQVGTLDWARWPGYTHKANYISNVTIAGGTATYDGDPRRIGTRLGIRTRGSPASFEFTVQATTTERTLIFYAGGYQTAGRITASLPGAPTFTANVSGTGNYSPLVTLRFRADAAATLRVRFERVSGTGAIRMQAAALQGGAAPPTTNRAPVISGVPPATAMQGQAYSFTPTASDPDGNALTYTITNRPGWATFNGTTGRLSGTPSSSHVGPYGGIVISVSDGQARVSLPSFTLTVVASNRPPVISGTPPATVLAGQTYTFTPTSSDPDGNTLTFTATNLPGWATLDRATGRIRGTPTAANVGTYGNINLSVSDGIATTTLRAFSIQVVATATGSATLTWTAPTTNTNGTPLVDLAGYKIYWRNGGTTYPNSATIQNPGLTTYVVSPLTPGTWSFVVAAVNSRGVESVLSSSASKTVQ